jgi:hypothetical protein
MPYPFAHVAAAVPLCALLGNRGVPSALVIGSIVPDLWYFVPFVEREQAHSLPGLLWFCLPVSLCLYFAFHLLFKQPLLQIMPGVACRLGTWTCPALPPAPWHAVLISLIAGVLVHLAWDALTHPTFPLLEQRIFSAGGRAVYAHQILQHSSTLLGTAFLAWWAWAKLRARRRRDAMVATVPAPLQAAALAMLLVPPAVAFVLIVLTAWPSHEADLPTIRVLLRAAATTAVSVLGLGVVAYCVLWKLRGQSSSDGGS